VRAHRALQGRGRGPNLGVYVTRRRTQLAAFAAAALLAPLVATGGRAVAAPEPGDDAPVLLTPKGEIAEEFSETEESEDFAKLRDAYYETRLLAGDQPLTVERAAQLRRKAIKAGAQLSTVTTKAENATVGGAWTSVGPDPTVQVGRTSNSLQAVSGRIGALAVRPDGTIIAGAAQGGVWIYDATAQRWHSTTPDTDTQSVGALAVAPSDSRVVYLGSGEGALSGDSYYGDGVYRSADGGETWSHVSGSFFQGASTSDIVVDPTNADHVYIATLRGRGGIRRTTPPSSQPYGIWESTDGGATWKLLKGTTKEFAGATDLVMDPLAPNILWASFWGDGIYRSTNGGKSWSNANGSLPQGQFAGGATRFSLGIAHLAGHDPVLYTGFDYFDKKGGYHPSSLWRNDSGGIGWKHLPTGGDKTNPDSIADYCTTQCFYDNVVMPDPSNPDIVYVAGSYGYDQSPQSGGVYRSTDGGQTWKSLGYDLHPDFHAFAFEPDDTKHIVVGNDGGVWQSANRGGRLGADQPLSAADWENLNGVVNPASGAFVRSTGLRIGQFTSIATVPNVPNQYWGGTQDNGTQRKSTAAGTAGLRWFDQPSGDGGQVIVDQTTLNTNPGRGGFPAFVFGTYFGISPYRFDPDGIGAFFGNEPMDGGIDLTDRAEFYVPWVMNRANTNQMFLGTYRLYRTDNAEADSAADVHWDAISPDLTTGCAGTAPNGARGCFISAVGVADGGDGVYTGSDDGKVFVSPDAVTAEQPTWNDVTRANLPARPVSQIAVDRSNWRIAYLSYAGFSAATPSNHGHVFKTTDGGGTWTDISTELPDAPVNSVVLDPAFPDTLYAGTDIGVYVTTDGGGSWQRLGSAMPKVASWQLDFDASHRLLATGTHGRGAYTLTDAARQAAPALIVSKSDSGVPVGPGRDIHYRISVRNAGNQDATGVSIDDPLPAHTSFVSASDGGTASGGTVHWSGLTVRAGDTTGVDLVVHIDDGLPGSVSAIVDDGLTVAADGGFGTTGSPHTTRIAPAHAVTLEPAAQTGAARAGASATYHLEVANGGYLDDSYDVSASGSWTSTVYDPTCTTPVTAPVPVASGDTAGICVTVDVPATGAANGDKSDTSVSAVSAGDHSVSASAALTTIAVTADTLLVDNDNNEPDVAGPYEAALTAAGESFSTWDLGEDPELPLSLLTSHANVVWFTGNSYPAPITPYEDELAAFLDGGGRLLMSGQDILDQAAGTTAFVHDYLHIDWDGSEAQNDKATNSVTSVAGNPVSDGIGTVAIDHTVLGAAFEDQITPIAPATAAFTDTSTPAQPDALTVAEGPYKVVFLGFPLEAYGTAAQKADLVSRSLTWFGS
jgi:uncharacterized repeat protein (TIGR01451 family)